MDQKTWAIEKKSKTSRPAGWDEGDEEHEGFEEAKSPLETGIRSSRSFSLLIDDFSSTIADWRRLVENRENL